MRKTWMITGSSVGLGRAIVEAALARGDRVVATARNPSALDELAALHPETLHRIALDVGNREAWARAIDDAVAHFGGIDVLVNNAGYGAVGSIEDTPLSVIGDLINTNLMGTIHACQSVLPIMRGQGHGRIILISSIGARIATPGAGFYYASKAAVSALAESLALEAAALGIRVTAIEPGGMRTRFAEASSLKVTPWNAAYDSTVGATVAAMQSPDYASHLGDPRGHAALVLQVADLDCPPTRILAGEDAVNLAREAAETRALLDDLWSDLALSPTSSAM